MREIAVNYISKAIEDMAIDINHHLSPDMEAALKAAAKDENSEIGKQVLGQLLDNLAIADEEMIPICQDTGMAVVFLEVGQDVHFTDGDITEAVNEGVRAGYTKGYLRKSVVADPIERVNTNDNTPAVIHFKIVPGDRVKVTLAPKGFGSENMSRVFMLKPADGIEGIKASVLQAVKDAGPNACPPMVLGVGIGGTFEKCALLAKEALVECKADQFSGDAAAAQVKSVGSLCAAVSKDALKQKNPATALSEKAGVANGSQQPGWVAALEKELLEEINALGIGPAGLGGKTTALALHIKMYPTHIAGLPLAVNICCHVNRHATRII